MACLSNVAISQVESNSFLLFGLGFLVFAGRNGLVLLLDIVVVTVVADLREDAKFIGFRSPAANLLADGGTLK